MPEPINTTCKAEGCTRTTNHGEAFCNPHYRLLPGWMKGQLRESADREKWQGRALEYIAAHPIADLPQPRQKRVYRELEAI